MMFDATLEPPKKFDHLPPGNRRSLRSLTELLGWGLTTSPGSQQLQICALDGT